MKKRRHLSHVAFALVAALAGEALAQVILEADAFIDGDDDTYENLDIVVRGATLTINGSHQFASLTVERNADNEPGVVTHEQGFWDGVAYGMHLTITGDLVVQGGDDTLVASRFNVTGKGWCGTSGWAYGLATGTPEAGGSHGGRGGAADTLDATPSVYGAGVYDDWRNPWVHGSGTSSGGCGGGTIILDVAGSASIDGNIVAHGTYYPGASGSHAGGAGGTIRLHAATLQGTGSIRADGADAPEYLYNRRWGGGGGGRVSIQTDHSTFSGLISAFGGRPKAGYQAFWGGAGTVYLLDRSTGEETLIIANNGSNAATDRTELWGHTFINGDVHVLGGARLSHLPRIGGFHLEAAGDVIVDAISAIDAFGYGLVNGLGPGRGSRADELVSGAGHGGAGGSVDVGGKFAPGGLAYGSAEYPYRLGSGAASWSNGGGALRVTAHGQIILDGVVDASADGDEIPDSGSGGSILLAAPTLSGAGSLAANGAGAIIGPGWMGGGAGGRIAIYADDLTSFTGALAVDGGNGDGGYPGEAGTIHFGAFAERPLSLLLTVGPGESIQAAIDAIPIDGEIIVEPGVYNESIDFQGKTIHLRSSEGPQITIIDATGTSNAAVNCNEGESPETIIEGFTIRGGIGKPVTRWSRPPSIAGRFGGAISCVQGRPTIRGCIIEDNTASVGGGVAFLDLVGTSGGKRLPLVNFHRPNELRIEGCLFRNNHSDHSGGAVYLQNYGHMRLESCRFENNSAGGLGGALAAYWSAFNDYSYGYWSIGEFINSDYHDEFAIRSTPRFNSARIYAFNCVVSGNDAPDGGAMGTHNFYASARGTTIHGNTSTNSVLHWIECYGSIISGNAGTHIEGDRVIQHCNVEGGHDGTGNIDADPLFVDAGNGDFNLRPGSPCIDAAWSTGLFQPRLGGTGLDYDGKPRWINDPASPDNDPGFPQWAPAPMDMGALEYCPGDLDGDGDTDQSDLGILLASYLVDGDGDLDGDGDTDQADLGILLGEYECGA